MGSRRRVRPTGPVRVAGPPPPPSKGNFLHLRKRAMRVGFLTDAHQLSPKALTVADHVRRFGAAGAAKRMGAAPAR